MKNQSNRVFTIGVFMLWLSALCPKAMADTDLGMLVNQGQLITLKESAKAIFIADPDIASYQAPSSRSIFVFGKKPGVTSLYVLGKNERVIYKKKIRVQHDTSTLKSILKQQFPNDDISISSVSNKMVVSGRVRSPQQADRVTQVVEGFLSSNNPESIRNELLNQLVVDMPNQVNIRIRIAEMERNIARQFGFDDLVKSGATGLGFSLDVAQLGLPLRALEVSAGKISGLLKALEKEGLVSILAEPNLTALSGEPANFLVGGQFPVVTDAGNGQSSVEYKKYGIELDMTPTVLSPGRISLKVNPSVSEVVQSTDIQPGLQSPYVLSERSAKTTVELASGQSFILAGLLYEKENTEISEIPWLSDIPLLGMLFRSERYLRKETELVIIATAYIVEPTSEKNLRIPQDGYQPYAHWQRFLTGKILKPKSSRSTGVLENGKPYIIGDYGLVF